MISTVIFGVFSVLVIAGVSLIILKKNLVHAVYAFALVLLGVAALFVLVGAEVLAIVQILLYAGGVVILLAFGIMMTNRLRKDNVYSNERSPILPAIISVSLFAILVYFISKSTFISSSPIGATPDQVAQLGVDFLTDHLIAFELIAFILLVALVGAAYLAKMADEA